MPDAPTAPVRSWRERLTESLLRPAKTLPTGTLLDVTSMSDEEKRRYIARLDDAERKIGFAASIIGVLLSLGRTVPFMVKKITVTATFKPIGKHCPTHFTYVQRGTTGVCRGVYPVSHYIVPLILALVLSLAIFVTVRIGKRTQAAFTVMITGLALGSIFMMVPFLLAGGWIMLRAFRCQKYGAPNRKTPLPGWVPPPPRTRQSRARGRRATDTSHLTSSGRPRPTTANKRYTPKAIKPPKK